MKNPIKVIVADDCKVTTQLLCAILNGEPDIEVIACVADGHAALNLTKKLKPDLVTMDIFMPIMDGVEATRAIMEQCPTPIIIISSHANESQTEFSFNALQAGALSVIEKPQRVLDVGFDKIKRQIINSVRALSEVKVVSRRPQIPLKSDIPSCISNRSGIELIALGSSTGGPEALNCILSALPARFPVPIVITQHITDGFLPGLVHWLKNSTELIIEIATNYQKLLPGHVYFADDNTHLTIKNGINPIAILDSSDPIAHFRPSINVLFSSIAKNYPQTAVGGLLTGMGKDGADGLLQMKEAGCVTFAQSEKTSVVYGMPAMALSTNATDLSIDLEKISKFLTTLVSNGGNIS